jgi:hypothetical protein
MSTYRVGPADGLYSTSVKVSSTDSATKLVTGSIKPFIDILTNLCINAGSFILAIDQICRCRGVQGMIGGEQESIT